MDLERLATRAKLVLNLLSLLGVVIFGIALAILIVNFSAHQRMAIDTGAAMVTAALGVILFALGLTVRQLLELSLHRAGDDRWQYEQLMGAMENQRALLEKIHGVAALSDSAKQIAFRTKDLDALRSAIREDIEKNDFESALMLAEEMERRFGYKLEADRLREQIHTSSRAAIDARVHEVVEHVDALLKRYDWTDAQRECDRLLRSFPLHQEARSLPDRIAAARDAHKRDLLKQWKDAIARDDVDRGIELLKQLDQYLSPSEAEAYKESARDVFKKRLQQLGVQFALHVHDKNWNESLRIAKQIIDEFPNTRMANEIKERLPGLTEKAQHPVGA